MRRADRVHVYLDLRMVANDVSRRACVVQVDVGEEQMADLREVDPAAQLVVARRGTAIEEGGAVRRVDHVNADHAL